MKIALICGAVANKPLNGGAAWTRLNWLLGFQKMGFDAYFVEQLDSSAGEQSSAYFRKVVEQFGLQGRASLVHGASQCTEGMDWNRLLEIAGAAELLVNISGNLTIDTLKTRIPVKAYIDLDPGFTQCWNTAGTVRNLAGHDYYFTVGENIGRAGCAIPTDGIRWMPTRQPVVLEEWPETTEGDPSRFTTIASWRGPYGPVQYAGQTLGSKVRQFRKYAALPATFDQTFEIALDIHPADDNDRELLRRNSWKLVDPRSTVADPLAFRRYVQGSGAEFSVAQQMYVETGSGWFSDRSVRYLASGKPVLVEDTGFRRNYPVGEGLLAFSSFEECVAGVREISRNYAAHAGAARQLAVEWFDSNRVIGQMLDDMGMCS